MEITCIEVEPGRVELRPADHKRAWMDATPQAFAYRCTPLNAAASHGWEMVCPVGLQAVWDGGPASDAVRITLDGPAPKNFVDSHFGSGILTFNPLVIVRTGQSINTWVSGPPNAPKDGVAPLSAVIESDWLPFTFSMNWKLTRAGLPVRFERGEPFCFFYPVVRGLIDSLDPVLARLDQEPAVNDAYWAAFTKRGLAGLGAGKQHQGWYTRGEQPDGRPGPRDHQTRAAARPFRRR